MNEAWHQSLIAEKYCQLVGFVLCYLRNKWNGKFEFMWTNKTSLAVKHEKPIFLSLYSFRVDARWFFIANERAQRKKNILILIVPLTGIDRKLEMCTEVLRDASWII